MVWPKAKERKTRRSPEVIELDNVKRRDLISRAKAGDERALKEYRELNQGLEDSIVKTYARWVLTSDLDDMRQEGFIGLLKGIEAYSLDKSATSGKPEGYIYSWVRAYVSNYARKHGAAKREQEVTVISLHGHSEDENEDILDHLPSPDASPEDQHLSKDLLTRICVVLKTLPAKERVIIQRRLMADEPETLSEIGIDLGVSRERVRQIETAIKIKLVKKIKHLRCGS